jgi:acetolactate synthase regulatory subunit
VLQYAIEITLQDRPGALALVAAIIGRHGGNVIDIHVLEHRHGRARDEITVELPTHEAADTLAAELAATTGVELEHIAPLTDHGNHLLVDALDVASAIVAETAASGLFEALVSGIVDAFAASWAVVVSDDRAKPLASAGYVAPPPMSRRGAGRAASAEAVDDVAVVALGDGAQGDRSLSLVAGREGWAWRRQERRELASLARICALRLDQMRSCGS